MSQGGDALAAITVDGSVSSAVCRQLTEIPGVRSATRDRDRQRRRGCVELTSDIDVRRSYARDASGLEMVPDVVARPASVADVVDSDRDARGRELQVTAAGAQTSTTAASITDRGILLSMRAMGRILDIDRGSASRRASSPA